MLFRSGLSRRRVNLEAAHWLRLGIEDEDDDETANQGEAAPDGSAGKTERL